MRQPGVGGGDTAVPARQGLQGKGGLPLSGAAGEHEDGAHPGGAEQPGAGAEARHVRGGEAEGGGGRAAAGAGVGGALHGAEAAGSANATLLCALSVLNRRFAPYLPFVAEEVWSWWQPGSVHTAPWPSPDEIERLAAPDPEARHALDRAVDVLAEIRRVRSTTGRTAKTRIRVARVHDTAAEITWLRRLDVDLRSGANADRFEFLEKPAPMAVELEFEEATASGDARG